MESNKTKREAHYKEVVEFGLAQIPKNGLRRIKRAMEETPEQVLLNGAIVERLSRTTDEVAS